MNDLAVLSSVNFPYYSPRKAVQAVIGRPVTCTLVARAMALATEVMPAGSAVPPTPRTSSGVGSSRRVRLVSGISCRPGPCNQPGFRLGAQRCGRPSPRTELAQAKDASIYTTSGAAAREFRYRVQAGNIGINVGVAAPVAYFPFGGMKKSFFGTLHGQGRDAIRFFTESKVVITRWI